MVNKCFRCKIKITLFVKMRRLPLLDNDIWPFLDFKNLCEFLESDCVISLTVFIKVKSYNVKECVNTSIIEAIISRAGV